MAMGYDDPLMEVLAQQNRGPTVLIVTTVMLCLSTMFVVLRLISRIGVVRQISSDDYAIIVAWLISFGFSFSICYGTAVGLGRHAFAIPLEHQVPLKKTEYAFSVLYNPALMATKTSICLFYLKLSKNQPIFKWLTVATFVVVNVAGLALTFLNIFQCRPPDAAFTFPTPSSASCTNIVSLYLSSAPVNIITDLALLFLPMPILTGMRLPRNEKIILIITFSFGGFVAIVDVVRIAYLESAALANLESISSGQSKSLDAYGDYSWFASLSFMWSAVEVNIGMICACVPGVKPLVAKIAPSLLGKIKGPIESKNTYWAASKSQLHDDKRLSHRSAQLPSPTSVQISPQAAATTALVLPGFEHGPSDHETSRNNIDDLGPMVESTKGAAKEMGMMDFLTTPDMAHAEARHGPQSPTSIYTFSAHSAIDGSRRENRRPSLAMLDFVNMKSTQSLIKMSNRESFLPNALVTILFFLWGFAYGLLDILNQQFQAVVKITPGQAIGLHSAYYGAYLIGPLTFGGFIFRRKGFKFTFIVGLCVYGIGTLVFWPSAVLASFPAFLVSNLIIGLGVSTLEIAGNPFIALCGPPEYAEVRLNISQGFQAIGSVVSPLLAKKVLFRRVTDAGSLIDVQWAYLGICLFDLILALVFYYLPIPEATDLDFEEEAKKRNLVNRRPVTSRIPVIGRIPVVYMTLAIGIFAQFCYVGGQEAIATSSLEFIAAVHPRAQLSGFDFQAIGHTVFAVGRFITAALGLFIKPRHLLLMLYIGVIVTCALAMSFTGSTGVAMYILILAFESGIFSLIFAISLRGLGSATKWGSAYITASISGGAIFPGIVTAIMERRPGPDGIRYAYCIPLAVFAFGALMPVYLEAIPAARAQVDPVPSTTVSEIDEKGAVGGGVEDDTGEHQNQRRKGDLPGC